jgi:bacillithiol biosynthesis cysteine-adding enzyme BshC
MVDVVPLDYRKLSYRPLFLDYLHRFEPLSSFFPGDPFLPQSWGLVARDLDSRKHPRRAVAGALGKLNRDLGGDEAALESLSLLSEGALAVVTGQQVGLFGGPLYTLYKALTAVRVARLASSALDRKIVPLFWMDADDHDFDEVRHLSLLSSSNELVDLRYDANDAERRLPVGARRLEPSIETVLSASSSALPPSEFRDEILEVLSRCYAPGRTLAEAFGSFLLHATRGTGLAVVDPALRELKALGSGLFAREVSEDGASSAKVRATTERILALGYHAQANTTDSQLNLFYANPERHALAREDSGFRLSADGAIVSRDEVERRVRDEPERFSPNVLLRPLYQDTLLPTLAYVAGPNELAYFAQLKDVYAHFGVTMPLIATRNSFTVVERRDARFLERYDLDWTRLQSDDESLLNEILRRHTPPQLEEDLTRARSCIHDITQAIARDLASVDPTLVPAAESTRGKLLHHLGELESKALRAVKRKNETVRNQFLATRTALFPGFDLQERRLSPLVFLDKHGWHFSRMIEESCDPGAKSHLLLYT